MKVPGKWNAMVYPKYPKACKQLYFEMAGRVPHGSRLQSARWLASSCYGPGPRNPLSWGQWWLRRPQKGNRKTSKRARIILLPWSTCHWYPTISPSMSHLYIYIPFFYGGDTQVAAGWITKDQDGEQRALALRPGRLLHSRQSNRAFKDQNVSICKFRKWSGPIFLGTPLKPLVDHHGSSSILVKRCHLKRWPEFAEDTPAHICWILYLYK